MNVIEIKKLGRRMRSKKRCNRRGAVSLLLALLLPVMLILSAFVINLAYVQLSRTELMVATDAAARSGGRAISFFQNLDDAREAARVTAALNTINGNPLQLNFSNNSNDVLFGESKQGSGSQRYQFNENSSSALNAIKVTGQFGPGTSNGQLAAVFPTFGMQNTFNVKMEAVAMQLDRDVALVLDRSGSMNQFSYSFPNGYNPFSNATMAAGAAAGLLNQNSYTYWGQTYNYYSYAANQNRYTYYKWLYESHWQLGPNAPFSSLWADLLNAVDKFLEVLDETDQSELVSVSTYASNARLDTQLSSNYGEIMNQLNQVSPSGATGIGRGLTNGFNEVTSNRSRQFAAKTIVVMTDGWHNSGPSPVSVVRNIVTQADVTVHTVTFGSGADQNTMQEVAEEGGGVHYHAANASELQEVFEEIANNLPTLITQ
ncbi:MAG: Tad domain-containing protein [Planctomycetota bacterium]